MSFEFILACLTVTSKRTNPQQRRHRQRSLLEEQESINRALKDKFSDSNSTQPDKCVTLTATDDMFNDNDRIHSLLNKERFVRENNNNRIESPTQHSTIIDTVSSSDSSTSTLTPLNGQNRLEGDNISIASTTSSLSTSSIATTDSSTMSDGAKRQSVSSLSDLEHLGELPGFHCFVVGFFRVMCQSRLLVGCHQPGEISLLSVNYGHTCGSGGLVPLWLSFSILQNYIT